MTASRLAERRVIKGKWPRSWLPGCQAQGSRQLGGAGSLSRRGTQGSRQRALFLPGTVAITRELWLRSKVDSRTGSKVESARIRRGPSAPWPRGRFQAEHLNYGKLWGGLLRGGPSGRAGHPLSQAPAPPTGGCSGSRSQSVKWHQGCPDQERNELLLLHFSHFI